MKIEKTFSAESAIHFRYTSSVSANAALPPPKAFGVVCMGDLNSWGAATGSPRRIRPAADSFEIAPLALRAATDFLKSF